MIWIHHGVARERGLIVIETAQAHGGRYRGRPLGSIGDCATFHSAGHDHDYRGEGGIFVTDDDDVWRKVLAWKDHGKSWRIVQIKLHIPPASGGCINPLGQTGGWTEMVAAIGRRQLAKLDVWWSAVRMPKFSKKPLLRFPASEQSRSWSGHLLPSTNTTFFVDPINCVLMGSNTYCRVQSLPREFPAW